MTCTASLSEIFTCLGLALSKEGRLMPGMQYFWVSYTKSPQAECLSLQYLHRSWPLCHGDVGYVKWPSGLRGAEVHGSVCSARETKRHPGKERGLGSRVMLSQRLMPPSCLKLLFFMLCTPGWGPGSSQPSPRSALTVRRALGRRPGWDTKATHSHSLCSPWKPSCSLLSTRSLILHRGRDLPCTAASDVRWLSAGHSSSLCSAALSGSSSMGKQAFALHAILFPKRSTSAAGVKSAKQSRVIDALLLVKEAWARQREGWISYTAQKKRYHWHTVALTHSRIRD